MGNMLAELKNVDRMEKTKPRNTIFSYTARSNKHLLKMILILRTSWRTGSMRSWAPTWAPRARAWASVNADGLAGVLYFSF